MPYNSNLQIEFHGTCLGQTCFANLEYHKEVAVANVNSQDAAVYVRDAMWAALKPALSDQYTLNEIVAEFIQTGVSGSPSYILPVGESGGVDDSDCLPPNVTVVMAKVPDNATKEPIGVTDFRLGRTSWSGIPEIHQENGLLEAGAIALFDSIFEAFEEITLTIAGTPYTWTLGLERGESNPPKVLVAETYAKQKLGTQNSRKR